MRRAKSDWTLKVRVWVHRNGQKVLGPGRAELLGHILRLHSISAAAKQMNMSYRGAWGLVRSTKEGGGESYVEVPAGGPGGGGASLTPLGVAALARYRRIVRRLAQATPKSILPATGK